MSAGLQVRDQNGAILLDTQRMFLGLVKSAPLTWLKGRNYGQWDDFGISFEGIAPVVYISGGATPVSISRSGNWWTFYYRPVVPLWVSGRYYLGEPPGMDWWPDEVRAYIFDYMRPNKRRVGLEVRHPDGRVAFNSDQHAMNVVARITPPPVHTGYKHRPPYANTKGWLTDTSFPSFGYQASTNLTNWGLVSGKSYAWNQPWTRGANGYGAGDNRALLEAAVLRGDMFGLTWQVDPFVTPQFAGDQFQPVYSTFETPSPYTIVDVTGLPYPMDY